MCISHSRQVVQDSVAGSTARSGYQHPSTNMSMQPKVKQQLQDAVDQKLEGDCAYLPT
jgi:hypothetical protein